MYIEINLKTKVLNSLDTCKVIPATVARAIFTLIAWARYFLCCGGHQKYNAPAADPKEKSPNCRG